jgi:TfoX/Sxy family transcriptional regulator of competence genes
MNASATSKSTASEAKFELIATELLKRKGIEQGRMFGSAGLKVSGKVFAMCVNSALVVKLSTDRVQALINAKQASAFDPGHGRPMKEWLSVLTGTEQGWLALAEESRTYVAAIEAKKAK